MFYDDDADLSVVQGRHVAVLGYGSQGHAHALSLCDSGVDVRVGLPEGSKSREPAEAEGLRVLAPDEACEEADLVMVLAPDPVQRHLFADAIAPSLVDGDALFFGHGFNIRFGLVEPPPGVDVAMVASKGTPPAAPGRSCCRTPRRSGAPEPVRSRRRSPRRPRPTCSASRRCCAA